MPSKRGGWRNPASAANGQQGGRPRRQLVQWHGEQAVLLRAGDTVAVIAAGAPRLATVTIAQGALVLTNDTGDSLTIVLSE